MKVTQEKLPASQIGLEIEIPAEMSKKVYDQVVNKLSKSVRIPGFRKGKVPRTVLIQQLGPSYVKATALEELLQDVLPQALKDQEVEAIGQLELRSSFENLLDQFTPGQPLTVSAAVDVQPEVTLADDYASIQAQAEEVVYDPKKVDDFLAQRQESQATLIPVEGRAAQMGDVAVVDYKSKLLTESGEESEETIAGGESENFQVELKEGRFLPEFMAGIVGLNPGESAEVTLTFPEDYREDLAGKTAQFSITLKELKEKEFPPLDDDFAKEVSEFETIAELRESIEKQFQDQAAETTKSNKEEALLKALLPKVEADLPATLIDQEVDTIVRQTAMQFSQMGMDVKKFLTKEMVGQMRERARPEAINRLKQALALEEIAKRQSLEIATEELETKVAELREQFSGQSYDLDRLTEFVKSDLLKEKAMDWLVNNATLELVPEGTLSKAEEESEAVEVEVLEPESSEG